MLTRALLAAVMMFTPACDPSIPSMRDIGVSAAEYIESLMASSLLLTLIPSAGVPVSRAEPGPLCRGSCTPVDGSTDQVLSPRRKVWSLRVPDAVISVDWCVCAVGVNVAGTPVRSDQGWVCAVGVNAVGFPDRFPAAARAELRHPVRMAFAPTLTIAILVLATGLQDLTPGLAVALWWIGAIGHLAATLAVLTAWLSRPEIGLAQVTPAWFIPVVGNVVTPLAAPALGSTELAWFAFGVGLVAWLGLFPILLHRLLLLDTPLPARLRPTLMILVAPPAVMVLSLTSLLGGPLDPVRKILFGAAVFAAVRTAARRSRS